LNNKNYSGKRIRNILTLKYLSGKSIPYLITTPKHHKGNKYMFQFHGSGEFDLKQRVNESCICVKYSRKNNNTVKQIRKSQNNKCYPVYFIQQFKSKKQWYRRNKNMKIWKILCNDNIFANKHITLIFPPQT